MLVRIIWNRATHSPRFRVILHLEGGEVAELADQDVLEGGVLVDVLILVDGVAPDAVAVLVELDVADRVPLNACKNYQSQNRCRVTTVVRKCLG